MSGYFPIALRRAGIIWLSLPLIGFFTLTIIRLFQGNDIFGGALVETVQRVYDSQDNTAHDLGPVLNATPDGWNRWELLASAMKWVILSYAIVALAFLATEVLLRLAKVPGARAPGDESYARLRPFRVVVLALMGILVAAPILLWISGSSCFDQPTLNFACGGSLSLLLASLTLASWIIFMARALVLHQIDKGQPDR